MAFLALGLAIGNLRRSRRLKTRMTQHQESTEQQLQQLRSELERDAAALPERSETAPISERLQQELGAFQERLAQCQKEVADLRGEAQNLAVLPTWHPIRVKLAEELRPRLVPITDKLGPVLFPHQIAFDELDWMYKLPDRKFPYSLTFEEGMMMHYLVAANELKSGYEIATAFGFSSFFLATAFEKTGGHLISADAYIEEEMEHYIYDHATAQEHVEKLRQLHRDKQYDQLPRGLQFALEGAATLNIESVVDYEIACSPEGVPELLGDRTLDFAFIDGGHFGEQPVLDVKSVLPYLHPERFLMMFHDTQGEAVAKAVHFAAQATGIKPFSIHTRNRIVAVAKGIDPATLQTCREMTVRQAV
ncbi:class I SAM-dependent methyltransferase [Stieleria sp. ICT_E10.1]|uniref:class I SAM-dependent methyltransferase n=1 Tax=Stieleria sedimenti TaxID=2976331 RepID=UPI0021807FF6|nr:class I SAM-dependent methyltransferase [Stieleria sedimenti]MCS7466959.1 class I SAM-dependent methyltransferase [Stieleria sedimenti]